jgi:sterol desaturase/sphingolipid hydroxylase (fatty acid hydroxylase superfamily)
MQLLVELCFCAIALCYANFIEWFLHRYLLHALGKLKRSPFAFHWYVHHRASRDNMTDPGYAYMSFHRVAEVLLLLTLLLLHIPVCFVSVSAYVVLAFMTLAYLTVHTRAHRDPDWARKRLTWHYDHHVGPDQDANWCVTFPMFDIIMGTRKKYAFTAREIVDRASKRRHRARREARRRS